MSRPTPDRHRDDPQPVPCTASGSERSWEKSAWINGHGLCPDCGADVGVWVRGTDRLPRAKARAHKAPVGVTPAPYAVHANAGQRVVGDPT